MFDRGTGNIGVSRGDGTAGKLPCLRLANPQPKSTLLFSSESGTPQSAGLLRWERLFSKHSTSSLLRQFEDFPRVSNGDSRLLEVGNAVDGDRPFLSPNYAP